MDFSKSMVSEKAFIQTMSTLSGCYELLTLTHTEEEENKAATSY